MYERVKTIAKKPEIKPLKTNQVKKSNNSSTLDHILFLHQTIGNQAVQRLFKAGIIQAKLKIGKPNDIYEKEAERVAEEIMRMPEPTSTCAEGTCEKEEIIQPKSLANQITPLVQRQGGGEEEKEKEILQPKTKNNQVSEVSPDLESRINFLRNGGQPLPESVRSFFEPRFGYDFSNVRIHNDAESARLARQLNAQAFTYGRDIFFGAGKYSPSTFSGKRLLAHELTHVVQQGSNIEKNTIQRYQAQICGRKSTQFPDFPKTYIKRIDINLSKQQLNMTWEGPNAQKAQKEGKTGPFPVSTGAGKCCIDCDKESRKPSSLCTPKGEFFVEKYECTMPGVWWEDGRREPVKNATYFVYSRKIAIHASPGIPEKPHGVPMDPESHGCVRVNEWLSEIIYDNSRKHITRVVVYGTWKGKYCYNDQDERVERVHYCKD